MCALWIGLLFKEKFPLDRLNGVASDTKEWGRQDRDWRQFQHVRGPTRQYFERANRHVYPSMDNKARIPPLYLLRPQPPPSRMPIRRVPAVKPHALLYGLH